MKKGLSTAQSQKLYLLGQQKQLLQRRLQKVSAAENPDVKLLKKLEFDLRATQKGLYRKMGEPDEIIKTLNL